MPSIAPRTTGIGRAGLYAGLAAAVAVPTIAGAVWLSRGGDDVAVETSGAPAELALDDGAPIRHTVDLGHLGSIEVLEEDGVLVLGETMVAEGWDITGLKMSDDGALLVTLDDGERQLVATISDTGEADDLEVAIGPPVLEEKDEPAAPVEAQPAEDPGDDEEPKDVDSKDDSEPITATATIDAGVADVTVRRTGDVLTYEIARVDEGFEHHTWANDAADVKGWLTDGQTMHVFRAWIDGDEIETQTWIEELAPVETGVSIDAEVGTVEVWRVGDSLFSDVTALMDGFEHVAVTTEGPEIKGSFTNGVDTYWFKAWIDGGSINSRAWHERAEGHEADEPKTGEPTDENDGGKTDDDKTENDVDEKPAEPEQPEEPVVEVQTRAEMNVEVGTVVVERDGDALVYDVTSLMDGFQHVAVASGGVQAKGYFTNGVDEYWFKAWIEGAEIKTMVWHERIADDEA